MQRLETSTTARGTPLRLDSTRQDLLIAGILGLFGPATRLPYAGMIPVFTDGVIHTLYALSIQPGKFMPLKGLDPYSGPLFAYILAGWLAHPRRVELGRVGHAGLCDGQPTGRLGRRGELVFLSETLGAFNPTEY